MAITQSHHLLLFFLMAIFMSYGISAMAQPPRRPLLGGWGPIQNVDDPQVQAIAKFAIAEHKKQSGERLVYLRVIKGETQVVAGVNYRLLIRARTRHGRSTYEAVVFVQSWTNTTKLVSFTLVP